MAPSLSTISSSSTSALLPRASVANTYGLTGPHKFSPPVVIVVYVVTGLLACIGLLGVFYCFHRRCFGYRSKARESVQEPPAKAQISFDSDSLDLETGGIPAFQDPTFVVPFTHPFDNEAQVSKDSDTISYRPHTRASSLPFVKNANPDSAIAHSRSDSLPPSRDGTFSHTLDNSNGSSDECSDTLKTCRVDDVDHSSEPQSKSSESFESLEEIIDSFEHDLAVEFWPHAMPASRSPSPEANQEAESSNESAYFPAYECISDGEASPDWSIFTTREGLAKSDGDNISVSSDSSATSDDAMPTITPLRLSPKKKKTNKVKQEKVDIILSDFIENSAAYKQLQF